MALKSAVSTEAGPIDLDAVAALAGAASADPMASVKGSSVTTNLREQRRTVE